MARPAEVKPVKYTHLVALSDHELHAMRELVIYGRAIAKTLGRDSEFLAEKLVNYAQMVEDVISRIETAETEKPPSEE